MKIYICIPSGNDEDSFKRFPQYDGTNNLFLFSNGICKLLNPENASNELTEQSELIVAGVEVLGKLAEQIKQCHGIFVHYGGQNSPTYAHALAVLKTAITDERIRLVANSKAVSFSRATPFPKFRVRQLGAALDFLSRLPNLPAEDLLQQATAKTLPEAFLALRRQTFLPLLMRLSIMLQGIQADEVGADTKSKWERDVADQLGSSELKAFEDSSQLGAAVAALGAAWHKTIQVKAREEIVHKFLKAVRDFSEKLDQEH